MFIYTYMYVCMYTFTNTNCVCVRVRVHVACGVGHAAGGLCVWINLAIFPSGLMCRAVFVYFIRWDLHYQLCPLPCGIECPYQGWKGPAKNIHLRESMDVWLPIWPLTWWQSLKAVLGRGVKIIVNWQCHRLFSGLNYPCWGMWLLFLNSHYINISILNLFTNVSHFPCARYNTPEQYYILIHQI